MGARRERGGGGGGSRLSWRGEKTEARDLKGSNYSYIKHQFIKVTYSPPSRVYQNEGLNLLTAMIDHLTAWQMNEVSISLSIFLY